MNSKIRVGIIGVSAERGWASIAHIPALKALADYEIVAISNRNPEKAAAAASAYLIPQVFHNNLDLINSPDVDLVLITVKVPEHKELVQAAITAGKHIYCEWPLGNGLAETLELNNLADKNGIFTVIGLQSRAVPAIRYVKDLVKSGYVGEVLSTTLTGSGIIYGAFTDQAMAYAVDAKNGAGMIYATFGHAVDVLCDTLGEFKTIGATAVNRRKTTTLVESGEQIPMTAYDQIAVNGVLTSGAVASIHYRGGMFRGTNFQWEINGTKGDLIITADGGHPAVFPLTIKGGNGEQTGLEVLEVPGQYLTVEADGLYPAALNMAYQYQWLHNDLKEGTRLSASFDDAVLRHRMIAAIELAAESGNRQNF
jgi:predicted dehydrogenase